MHRLGWLLWGSLFFAVFLFAASAHAAEATLFNFGTMQEISALTAEPGENVTLNIYFFMDEKYGNRITHVRVGVEQAPPGWVVEISPPLGKSMVNVSGVMVTSEENLYVAPKPVLPSKPENPEPGVYYLKSPSGLGYLQAKRLQATVRVPANATLGKTYSLKLAAEGFWFGTAGNIALTQSRPFSYSITVAKKEYSEKVLTQEEIEALGKAKSQQEAQMDFNQLLVYVLGAAVVVLILYIIVSRGKKK